MTPLTAILIAVLLKSFQPLPVRPARAPFSHADWIFEIKWDGFRSLAYVDRGECKLLSRNGNQFKSFPCLTASLPSELRTHSAVLDGEIVCLDRYGKPQFRNLLFRREEPRYIAFDILWCEGEDLRYLPLIERKQRLRVMLPKTGERVLYCDHVEREGEEFFRLACKRDLEGVVAKRKGEPYLVEHAEWLKIRNQRYSQWQGREQLFERERGAEPSLHHWDECALACESGELDDDRADSERLTPQN